MNWHDIMLLLDSSDVNPMCFISIRSVKSWWTWWKWWRCSDNCDDHHHPLMIIMQNGINYLFLKWQDIILVLDVSDANPMWRFSIFDWYSWWLWVRCRDDWDNHHPQQPMIFMNNWMNYFILIRNDYSLV